MKILIFESTTAVPVCTEHSKLSAPGMSKPDSGPDFELLGNSVIVFLLEGQSMLSRLKVLSISSVSKLKLEVPCISLCSAD